MMLIHSYRWEFCRPPNPGAGHLRGVAHLDGDITAILPQLNRVLRGHLYFPEPPSLTIKYQAKLITFYPRQIAINILKDETEAEQIIRWLRDIINDTWEKRQEIQPRFEVVQPSRMVEILKMLPRTNCGDCGYATCLILAVRINEGNASLSDCPHL
ncbi:MAG TPA: Fe-S cluster protein [Desulfobacterales bacterium]|nr:Fe-S cluster protein [Desulfobacterales bacterium]